MSRRHEQPPLFDPDTGGPLEEVTPASSGPATPDAGPKDQPAAGKRATAPAPAESAPTTRRAPEAEPRKSSPPAEVGTRGEADAATKEELAEVGNALVRASADTASAVGRVPEAARRAIALRKRMRNLAQQLASMSWGQALAENTRMAVAEWGNEFGVDVTTEIDVLGSKIYLNSRFYLRKLSELVDAGVIEYAYADHVNDDPRLVDLAVTDDGAAAELARRRTEQVRHNCPPADKVTQCAAAVVFRVKLRGVDREFTGAKWCGDRGHGVDPVGRQFPVETAESRAARRCLRLFVTHLPAGWGDRFVAMEKAAEALEPRIQYDRDQLKAILAELPTGSSVEIEGLPGVKFHSGWPPETVPLKRTPDDPYQEPEKGTDAA